MTTAKRRPRRSRVQGAAVLGQGLQASPYIRRALPYFNPLSEEGLVKLEAQVDWLLENVGVEYRDDPEALDIWKRAGVDVQGTRIKADAQMIRALCAKAPAKFTQLARNRARSVEIGGNSQVFAPVYGAPFVRDLEGGRRYGDIKSFEQLVKLTYMLSRLHHGGFVTCEPCDIPVSKRHLDMLFLHMTASDKPHLGAITEMSRAIDSLEMAKIVFGREVMDENGVIMGNVNTNAPLLVDKVASEAIRAYCGRGQGVVVVPFILSGAMGPLSTAASIAQAMAEAISACAFAQLVRPGAPFVLGNFLSSMSLKTGAPTFGMPEPVLSNYVVGQLARRLGLPLRCGGSLTASKTAFYEGGLSDSENVENREERGSKDMEHRAYEGWNAMLQTYETPPMEPSMREELQAYVDRRKSELPDAWY